MRSRERRATLLALVTAALALWFTSSATAAPPPTGVLTGTSGCAMVIGGSVGCTPTRGIATGESVAISPDGRNVYATSFSVSSPSAPPGLAAFSRDPLTGVLTQLPGTSGCVTASGNDDRHRRRPPRETQDAALHDRGGLTMLGRDSSRPWDGQTRRRAHTHA